MYRYRVGNRWQPTATCI